MSTIYSPYQVVWVEFVPIKTRHSKKICTKKDAKRLFCARMDNGRMYKHFPSKAAAISFIDNLPNVKLDKSYCCYIFSDKQFSLWNIRTVFCPSLTAAQRQEVRYSFK